MGWTASAALCLIAFDAAAAGAAGTFLNSSVASTKPPGCIVHGKTSAVCGNALLQTASITRRVEAAKVEASRRRRRTYGLKPPYSVSEWEKASSKCLNGTSHITTSKACKAAVRTSSWYSYSAKHVSAGCNVDFDCEPDDYNNIQEGCYCWLMYHDCDGEECGHVECGMLYIDDQSLGGNDNNDNNDDEFAYVRALICTNDTSSGDNDDNNNDNDNDGDDWDFGEDEPLPGTKPDDHLGGIKRATRSAVKQSMGHIHDEIEDVAKAIERLEGGNGDDIKKELKPLKEVLESVQEKADAGKKTRAAISRKLEEVIDSVEDLSKVKHDLKKAVTKEDIDKAHDKIKDELKDAKDLTRAGINKLGSVVTKTQKYAQAIYKDVHNLN